MSQESLREAMNAPIHPQPCTGVMGRICSCGLWHTAYRDESDFLKKDNALSALARYVVRPLLIAACSALALYVAAGYIAAFWRWI